MWEFYLYHPCGSPKIAPCTYLRIVEPEGASLGNENFSFTVIRSHDANDSTMLPGGSFITTRTELLIAWPSLVDLKNH